MWVYAKFLVLEDALDHDESNLRRALAGPSGRRARLTNHVHGRRENHLACEFKY